MKKQKLFVAGLLNDNFYEAYYIIDLAQRESKEIIIDNTCEQANIIKLIKKQFSNRKLPYGAKNVKQFMPYLINPHSCYKIGDKMLSFMLQAPYFREIDINTLENNLVTYRDLDDITFSASSIGQSEDGCIYLSINSANARADIYNGIKSDIKCWEDYQKIRAICERNFDKNKIIYMQSDVCRQELLVEIEGVWS